MTKESARDEAEELKRLLAYDPLTGIFTRKVSTSSAKAGDIAGNKHSLQNRWVISYRGKKYWGHRVAWLLHHGSWPDGIIDHIDGDSLNNKIGNLRLANDVQNKHNTKVKPWSKTGFKGVVFDPRRGKWWATIRCNGARKHLGTYSDPREAAHAYNKAAVAFHGEFACLNPL